MLKMSGNVTKKNLVITALLEGKSVTQSSQETGVTERTIFRWLKDPVFTGELRRREGMVVQSTTTRLVSLCSKAVTALESVLDRPEQPGAGNLRLTAGVILELALKYTEMSSLEERLTLLEREVFNGKK